MFLTLRFKPLNNKKEGFIMETLKEFNKKEGFLMGTLKELYKDLIKDPDSWLYYHSNQPRLKYEMLFDETASYKFIKNYFKCGGKEKVFKDDPYIIKNKIVLKKRSPHIVSTFLLGILIAKNLKIDLNTNNNDNINFKYLWFMACLYHDIGYVYENDHNCAHLRTVRKDGLNALKDICNIKYLCDNEFKTYKKENIDLYLSNRAICSSENIGKIDHGIVGGLLLYDRLIKNYYKALNNAKRNNPNVSNDKFKYNKLNFSNKHFKYYAEAADAIIAHNIWINTLNEYLIKNDKEPLKGIKIDKNNKIAFILALADTLEPIKKPEINDLDMISFEEVEDEEAKDGKEGFDLIISDEMKENDYEYICNLSDWINVDVNRCGNRFSIRYK